MQQCIADAVTLASLPPPMPLPPPLGPPLNLLLLHDPHPVATPRSLLMGPIHRQVDHQLGVLQKAGAAVACRNDDPTARAAAGRAEKPE